MLDVNDISFLQNYPGPNESVLGLNYLPIAWEKRYTDYAWINNRWVEWVFLPIPNTSNLYIDSIGNVLNINTNEFLKISTNEKGYAVVMTSNNKECYQRSSKLVHRLILMAWRPCKEMNNLHVNHIDLNKLNNNLDNLEWCTTGQNGQHWRNIARGGNEYNIVGVLVHNVFTDEIMEFNHIVDCAFYLGISTDAVQQRLNKGDKHIWTGGFRFKRKQDTSEWLPPTQLELTNISYGISKPVELIFRDTGEVYHANTVSELLPILNLAAPTVSTMMSKDEEIGIAKAWYDGNRRPFSIRYQFSNMLFKPYDDVWQACDDADNLSYVTVIIKDGIKYYFKSLDEVVSFTGMKKTAICYRLDQKTMKTWSDGLIMIRLRDM